MYFSTTLQIPRHTHGRDTVTHELLPQGVVVLANTRP